MDGFATGGQAAVVGYYNEGIDFCRPCDQSSNTSSFATWTFTYATPGKSTLCCQRHKCCLVTAPSPPYYFTPLSLRAGCGWKGPVQKMPCRVSLSVYQTSCKVLLLQQDNSRGLNLEREITKDLSFVTLVLLIQVGSAVQTLLAAENFQIIFTFNIGLIQTEFLLLSRYIWNVNTFRSPSQLIDPNV